jgi:uncharacterized membrane protein
MLLANLKNSPWVDMSLTFATLVKKYNNITHISSGWSNSVQLSRDYLYCQDFASGVFIGLSSCVYIELLTLTSCFRILLYIFCFLYNLAHVWYYSLDMSKNSTFTSNVLHYLVEMELVLAMIYMKNCALGAKFTHSLTHFMDCLTCESSMHN